MLNQIVLVGRLYESSTNEKLVIAVPRAFKNKEGIYETDFIECQALGGIAEKTKEYCKKGDLVGIRGRITTGNTIIVEKISFLKSGE